MKESETMKKWYLQSMGIQLYEERLDRLISTDKEKSMLWEALKQEVALCVKCPLHKTRTQTVFGVGSNTAELVLVGEAPGQQEDLKGEPFVGKAGQLLDKMLATIGLDRQQIYIANILKCRPPDNRDPSPHEQHCCTPYLLEQLNLLQPKLIVALGRISAQYLLQSNLPLSRLRNVQHSYSAAQIPLLVTYHPAYLLRKPSDKAKAWEDLLQVKRFLQASMLKNT